jgi:ankyrin repeat protein
VKRGAAKRAFATQPLFKAVVKLLLEQGAEPEFKDKYGQTPLSDELIVNAGRLENYCPINSHGESELMLNVYLVLAGREGDKLQHLGIALLSVVVSA